VALLQIAARNAERLSGETMRQLRECVDRAATCVLRRDVRPSYTNISALATYVLVAAGELLDSDAYLAAGRERAVRMAELVESAAIDEYFSPGYTGVALMGLLSVRTFTSDDLARAAARRIELRLWSHLADGWHLGSRELSGPHSRAYTVRMGFSWVAALLYRATSGELDWPESAPSDETGGDFLKVSCLVQNVDLPVELARRFTRPEYPRDVCEPGEQHPTDSGPRRTWYRARLTAPWCLGTVDLQDSRTDRQNVLAYWARAGSMIVRTRKDDGEGAFGLYVCADQDAGDVLVGVFAGGFDDPSPMRPRDGADAAWLDTVAIVEDSDPMEVEEVRGASRVVLVRRGETDLALWSVFHERVGAPTLTVSGDWRRLELRWVWYEGERRRVSWDEFSGSGLSLALSFREPGEPGDERSGRRCLSLRMPRETLPMRTLYARYLRA